MIDKLRLITIGQFGFSKLNAGNNRLPDWITNTPVGNTNLGTPYYDSVKFKLGTLESEEFVNSRVSVVNNAQIVKTMIPGRSGGSVKQLMGEGDYSLTFTIKVFAPMFPKKYAQTTQRVGNRNNGIKSKKGVADIYTLGQIVAEPSSVGGLNDEGSAPYQGDYYPNEELASLVDLFYEFYTNKTYINMEVESIYLNDIFGIYNIVPYSFSTQQSDSSNSYEITIQAYSDKQDPRASSESEIIPK